MTLLYKRGDVETVAARKSLSMTAGNLDSHSRKLEDAGWLESRKVLTKDGFSHRLRLTKTGAQSFRTYLQVLREFLESTSNR